MKLLQKMAAYFVRPLTIREPDGWYPQGSESHAGEGVNAQSVLGLSAAWACVNLLAGTIASLPLMVYRTKADGTRGVARDLPLYRLLHDSPNFDQTAVDFWEFISASIELWGNAYARKIRQGGRIVALEPVQPDIVNVRRLDNGNLEYRWTQDGRSYVLTQNDVLHIRGFGGNPLGGMSTLTFGRHAFGLASAIDKAAGNTFRNGLRPSGIMTFDQFLKAEQRDVIEKGLIEKFTGAMNAGRPMVLEGGTKWTQLTINPEDAQMLQSRGFSVEEVCRFFGVPPHMVGHTQNSTSWGTGLEQQTLGFQKFTLRRRLKRIEQASEKQLLTPAERAEGITIEFNLDGLLRGDSLGRAQVNEIYLRNKVLTINEVRAQDNKPPVPWGDQPWVQQQDIQIAPSGQLPKPEDEE